LNVINANHQHSQIARGRQAFIDQKSPEIPGRRKYIQPWFEPQSIPRYSRALMRISAPSSFTNFKGEQFRLVLRGTEGSSSRKIDSKKVAAGLGSCPAAQ
jgi:hypothetical protein